MRVHHLNCATMCPIGGPLVGDPPRLVCHVLLIESDDGLVLVDSGFGTHDCQNPRAVDFGVRAVARPRFSIEETAVRQIEKRGFSKADVRHIVPTHLDLDHAGGLPDFPEATVHVFRPEHDAAMRPRTFIEKRRYHRHHFAHGPKWKTYEVDGEAWFGFETVRGLEGLPSEILLVPLVGHTRGHVAVAVDTGEGWLLHAGDAYFNRGEMESPPRCPAGIAGFQKIAAMDDRRRLANQERLRTLHRDERDRVKIFSAHDPVELEALS